MAIEFRERRIGEYTYRVTQLGAKAGRVMMVRLFKLAGPGVGSFVGGVGRGGTSGDLEVAMALGFGDAVHDLAARISSDEVAAITDQFALQTVLVTSPEVELRLSDIFDDHFAGRYDEMLLWLRFCLEVNFTSFFRDKGGAAKGPLANLWRVLSALQSRTASTGTSTESPPASATPQA